MTALTTASRQLFSRPADETFSGWNHILDALRERDANTRERPYTMMTATSDAERIYMTCIDDNAARTTAQLTDWSFRQMCAQINGSQRTLNRLTPATAATAINELMTPRSGVANILQQNGSQLMDKIRGLYSDQYERVSDFDVFKFFHTLAEQYGYEPAGNFAGKRGGQAPIRPEASGLNSGDTSSFGIIANEEGKIEIDDSTLYHAVMFGNSEVGNKALWVTDCLYNFICGNHQLWGAERVRTIRHRHVGTVREVLEKSKREFFQVTDQERQQHREKIAATYEAATRRQFATSSKAAMKRLQSYIPKSHAVGALAFAGHAGAYPKNPFSDWGIGQAITLYSQTLPNQDTRLGLDTAAGKIIQGATHEPA